MAKKKRKKDTRTPAEKAEHRRQNLMTEEEWEKRDEVERIYQVRNARNNRTLFVQVVVSLEFFVNLYWFSLLAFGYDGFAYIIPLVNMVLAIAGVLECFGMLYKERMTLTLTYYGTIISALISIAIIVVTLLGGKDILFPFFASAYYGEGVFAVMLVLQILAIRKVLRIRNRRDEDYEHYVDLVSNK